MLSLTMQGLLWALVIIIALLSFDKKHIKHCLIRQSVKLAFLHVR
ncbi:hypothetical protein P20652_2080 [Pseudoalteromonas sp. BSi20652]|nr:hypothetical protein P20652_2080 [Pseudoalteromonas sp. BSi20652]